jgi:hypothetical protein
MPEETANRDVELSAEYLVDRLVLVSAPAPRTEPKAIDLEYGERVRQPTPSFRH